MLEPNKLKLLNHKEEVEDQLLLVEEELEMIKETGAEDKLVDILTILVEDKVLVTVCNGKDNRSIYKTWKRI